MSELGIVTIGRNEGERLRRCLDSVVRRGHAVVYVDSGSTDGSVELARAMGAEVLELDLSQPFTMARGRNLGFSRLLELNPMLCFVQFIDGDCELVDGWLESAHEVIVSHPEVAVVYGRCRERFRERSIYNRLADLDWDAPIGKAKYCGGNTMIRVAAFRQVGGFDSTLIAAEDSELCVRFRLQGWTILRIDSEMTVHDIAMTRFSQWWWRCVRTGYAYADGMRLHGKPPERHFVHEVHSILFWGLAVPLAILFFAWPTRGASLILLCGYFLLYWKIRRYGAYRGWSALDARLYALWCVIAKFPMLTGVFIYWYRRITRRPKRLIEYKGPEKADLQRELSCSSSGERLNENS
jgi:GT2 family glycosyltransferase